MSGRLVILQTACGARQKYMAGPYEAGGLNIEICLAVPDSYVPSDHDARRMNWSTVRRIFRRCGDLDGVPWFKEDIRQGLFEELERTKKALSEMTRHRDTLHRIIYQIDEGL